MTRDILFISAGAGSGKTYRITEYLHEQLSRNLARPEAVIATTFTKKAATELIERVRGKLTQGGRHDLSDSMGQALIGTVHSVCGKLLSRYAFEAGLSPTLEVLDENAGVMLFSQALEQAIELHDIRRMNGLARRLGQEDWKGEVRRVVDMARSNNLDSSSLLVQAQISWTELLEFFPALSNADLNQDLGQCLHQTIAAIEANDDSTKGTRTYLAWLKTIQQQQAQGNMPWDQWVKLSKEKPTKGSVDLSQDLRDLALDYERHPQLHRDIKDWIEAVFTLACKTLETYQRFKAQRGMMDFVDQEQQVYELLHRDEVAEAVAEELDLLLVDEFQDTSPIQLAIFLKLAQLAQKTVWVGDIKQAIYGFRGCDPELMNAVVKSVDVSGGQVEILPYSWRSRPQLVDLINALFVPAFSEILQKAQVELSPKRLEKSDSTALEFWTLDGNNQAARARALARGVANLFAENRQVVDKKTNELRPLRFSDVAVLSRMNTKAADYAKAIAERGLPVSLSQSGLLKTPEVTLALACLRRIIDPRDTLATAEIIALHGTENPESWLQERLEYLAAGMPASQWRVAGKDPHPVLANLEAERSLARLLSPSESVERAIFIGEVERVSRIWGPTSERSMQRLANLEALRGFARQYEDYCRQQRSAATVFGLVLWLKELADSGLDILGKESDADAVQVLTHHGAKGLEWHVVVSADLESGHRSRLWGLAQFSTEAEVDMRDPLAGRKLRYWVYPFGRQSAGIRVLDAINSSPCGLDDQAQQLAEAKRLLYVSFTRARDLLVLPMPAKRKGLLWLDSLEADWLQGADGELELPEGKKIHCAVRTLVEQEESVERKFDEKISWFPQRRDGGAHLPASCVPSSFPPVSAASIGATIVLGERIALSGAPDMTTVGDALHHLFAADFVDLGNPQRSVVAQALIDRFQLSANLDATTALDCVDHLRRVLDRDFKAQDYYPEWPVQLVFNSGQRMQGWIDLLIDTPDGWILIDHKSFPGSRNDWEKRALEYSGQLSAYKQAVEAATSKPVLSQWIHFSVGGGLVEVVL